MKYICMLSFIFLTACGTAAKIQTSGPIEANSLDVNSKVAALLMQFKFSTPSSKFEFFFWDQDKNRFNVEIKNPEETSSGIIVYLPANRLYALSGFLVIRNGNRIEYSLGLDLNMFKVKSGTINALPYFEIVTTDEGQFSFKQGKQIDLKTIHKKFPGLKKINHIDVKLLAIH